MRRKPFRGAAFGGAGKPSVLNEFCQLTGGDLTEAAGPDEHRAVPGEVIVGEERRIRVLHQRLLLGVGFDPDHDDVVVPLGHPLELGEAFEPARELLLEFADFTRYSFRRQGEFTTLAEELRSIHSYLELERSRFGDRLAVTLRIAPETLSTVIPFLSVQPIVENAVRHGLEPGERGGGIRIEAQAHNKLLYGA